MGTDGSETGTRSITGPAPTVIMAGGAPGCRDAFMRVLIARQFTRKIAPKANPPTTNAQNTITVKTGGFGRVPLIPA